MLHDHIWIPFPTRLYHELLRRKGGEANVAGFVENVFDDFLERTAGESFWSPEYLEQLQESDARDREWTRKFGRADKGYYWQNVFLPNGTRLRMTYRGEEHFAEVQHQGVIYEDSACSPSEMASRVANNTNRNAWRDIWIKRPDDDDWVFASTLRHAQN